MARRARPSCSGSSTISGSRSRAASQRFTTSPRSTSTARRSSVPRRSLRWYSPGTRHRSRPAQFIPLAEANGADPRARRVRAARGVRADRALAPRRHPARPVRHVGQRVGEAARRRSGSPRSCEEALDDAGLPPGRLGLEVTETAIVEDGARRGARAPGARGACTTSACGSRSTTSAPASRRSASCATSRSTCSRSTARSSTASSTTPRSRRSRPISSASPTRSDSSRSPRASRPTGQLEVFRELGCDQAQGFLFGRPAPPEEITEFLTARATPESR